MKYLTRWLLPCIFALLAYSASAQERPKKMRTYNVTIFTATNPGKIHGLLYQVSDSSIVVIDDDQRISVPAKSIQSLKIKRKAAVGRGAAVGALTGFGLGAMIGLASGDDECPQGSICIYQATAGEKALGGGIVLSGGGALIGLIIGSVSRAEKIIINGDPNTFLHNLETIKKYAGRVSAEQVKLKESDSK